VANDGLHEALKQYPRDQNIIFAYRKAYALELKKRKSADAKWEVIVDACKNKDP
ncbi:hypothetical protein NDU88_004596, partial [Pleurodeles waltl]